MKKNHRTCSTALIAAALMASWLTSCKRDLLPQKKEEMSAMISTGAYTVLTTERPSLPPVADGSVELGMQFKSSSSGTITKFRYYKVAGETGTHTGRLWSANGRLLKTAVFQ